MNLSHPEQYLAPLLSAMEREGGMVEFHRRGRGWRSACLQRIPYPRNLVLIGTVNMDETTMGLSDKVLDRAFTREFWDIEVDAWPGWEACRLADDEQDRVLKLLAALMAVLRPARLHFRLARDRGIRRLPRTADGRFSRTSLRASARSHHLRQGSPEAPWRRFAAQPNGAGGMREGADRWGTGEVGRKGPGVHQRSK